uniref:Uncharacterized protein n=1 Tax=viral metagenome TaxID=1070528 RepID=A0A6M3L1T5_9ZZZZ
MVDLLQTLFGGGTSQSGPAGSPWLGEEDYYRRLMRSLGLAGPEPTTTPPGYQAPADWQMLGEGDWQGLQESIAATPLRRMSEDQGSAVDRFRASMRAIGMADDPSAYKLQEETIDRPYTRGMTDILSNASATRYGLQNEALNAYNTGMTERAGQANQFNLAAYAAPLDYYKNKMALFHQFPTASPGVVSSEQTQTGILPSIASMFKFG